MRRFALRLRLRILVALSVAMTCGRGAFAESAADASSPLLPDAPQAAQNAPKPSHPVPGAIATQPNLAGKQTKRILGVIPNFRSVSADVTLPPQSARDRFSETTQDSFDYSAFLFAGVLAGIAQSENSFPEFHTGAPAFARYYWHTFADQTDENYEVEFLFPTVFRQDSRYYTMGHGNVLKRAAYSFSRVLITRTNAGHSTPNFSEILGAGGASGVSDLYYPSQERTWTKTGQRWIVNVGLDGGTFIFKEFWPDMNSRFFHQKD